MQGCVASCYPSPTYKLKASSALFRRRGKPTINCGSQRAHSLLGLQILSVIERAILSLLSKIGDLASENCVELSGASIGTAVLLNPNDPSISENLCREFGREHVHDRQRIGPRRVMLSTVIGADISQRHSGCCRDRLDGVSLALPYKHLQGTTEGPDMFLIVRHRPFDRSCLFSAYAKAGRNSRRHAWGAAR